MSETPLEILRRLDFYSADALDHLALERLRQIEGENWTPAHDDEHGYGQLANAAACYALSAADND